MVVVGVGYEEQYFQRTMDFGIISFGDIRQK
jgi:hypothetical protein